MALLEIDKSAFQAMSRIMPVSQAFETMLEDKPLLLRSK